MAMAASCGVPQNSIEVKTAREAAAANCDEKGKCIKDPKGLVLYNTDIITENNILKRTKEEALLTRLINLIDEPKLLIASDKMEALMRGVVIVGESDPCDSPRGIEGANPTAGQLRSLKQGRYKACVAYIGDGLFKKVYSLDAIDVDTTPPEVAGGLTASNVTPISAQVIWSKAGDNLTLEGKLSYTVYTSTTQNLNSLEAVYSYGNLVPGQIINGTSFAIINLTEKTQYHAAVLVADEAGNQTLVGSTNFVTAASDINPPSVTISSISPAVTKDNPVAVTINFSESVTGFDVTDIDVINASIQNFTGSGAAYTLDLVPTSDGEVTAVIAANKAQDIGANGNTASGIFTRVYDSTVPVAPVIADAGKAFNSSFVTTLQQGVPSDANFKDFRFTTDGSDPTCASGASSTGATASVTVPAQTTTLKAIVCDEVGYSSPIASAEYSFDNSRPSVSISSDVGAGPTNHSTITLTFTFSEPVNGFDSGDITLGNASKGVLTATSAAVYTLEITPTITDCP